MHVNNGPRRRGGSSATVLSSIPADELFLRDDLGVSSDL